MSGKQHADLINVTEAAHRCGVSADTIRRWIRQGKLRAQKIDNQYWIDPVDLQEVHTGSRQIPVEPQADEGVVSVLQERVRELERDKAYLQELVVDLRKQIERQQETIESMQRTIETLTHRALPPSGGRWKERIRNLFRRGKQRENDSSSTNR